jgi:single-stranded-DNA-specific exonuclease
VRWNYRTVDSHQIEKFTPHLLPHLKLNSADTNLADVLARLLLIRGIDDPEKAQRYLFPSIDHLHSPYLMHGMKLAVDRLAAAIERKEGILIYGDYDVDGTTAIVILKTAIELCGGNADFHVPHRIREGYDLRGDRIEAAAAAGIRLVVSVDSGIRAFAAAETARRLGVDLIVTDHHIPGTDGVPHALAVLNPNQQGCHYPCKALCGAGVAFKFAQALMERMLTKKDQTRLLTSFMKIVAIATIADSVPLAGENRVFAKLGLDALRSAVNPGLKALLEVAKLTGRPLTSSEVGFRIAPRINAAGRMDVAQDVIELFSVKDNGRAREIAAKLNQLNGDRQEEERRILIAIEARFLAEPALQDAFCIVIDDEGWHRGVIGITATRVVERYGRPTLIISRDGEDAHGSGRSIPAFHLLNALESCGHLFSRYGGHAHAVGFSIPAAAVPALSLHLNAYAKQHLALSDFEPVLKVDADIPFASISLGLYEVLRNMQPFGVGNPEPIFVARNLRVASSPQVLKDKHVKLRLGSASKNLSAPVVPNCHPDSASIPKRNWRDAITYNALGWNMAGRFQEAKLLPGDHLDIAFTLGKNDHPEFGGLELALKDFHAAEVGTAVSSPPAEQSFAKG